MGRRKPTSSGYAWTWDFPFSIQLTIGKYTCGYNPNDPGRVARFEFHDSSPAHSRYKHATGQLGSWWFYATRWNEKWDWEKPSGKWLDPTFQRKCEAANKLVDAQIKEITEASINNKGKSCENCGRNTDHGFFPPCEIDKRERMECMGSGICLAKWHMWTPEEKR